MLLLPVCGLLLPETLSAICLWLVRWQGALVSLLWSACLLAVEQRDCIVCWGACCCVLQLYHARSQDVELALAHRLGRFPRG